MKQRNMFAVHAWNRKAGAHGKTKKAQRRADKMKLHREL